MTTFGPDYNPALDRTRLLTQMERIRNYMLTRSQWMTIEEISKRMESLYGGQLRFPEPSVSAQLRHLRKKQFGGYIVEKRRRGTGEGWAARRGLWEYRLLPPAMQPDKQLEFIHEETA